MYLIHYIFCNFRFNSPANVIHVQTLNFFLANVGLISRQLLHKTACMSFNSFVNVWVIKWRILMATQVFKRRVVFPLQEMFGLTDDRRLRLPIFNNDPPGGF